MGPTVLDRHQVFRYFGEGFFYVSHPTPEHILITGSAGFIGSHLTARFLADGHQVTGIDNLIRGSRANLAHANENTRFQFYEADAADAQSLSCAIKSALTFGPVHCLWHLAANSDIGAGAADSDIDLRDTFLTTFQILKAMQEFDIPGSRLHRRQQSMETSLGCSVKRPGPCSLYPTTAR